MSDAWLNRILLFLFLVGACVMSAWGGYNKGKADGASKMVDSFHDRKCECPDGRFERGR